MASEPQLTIYIQPVAGLVFMGNLHNNTQVSGSTNSARANSIEVFYKPSDTSPKLYDRNGEFLNYLWFIEKTDSATQIEVVKGVDGMNKTYTIERSLGDALPALARTNKSITTAAPSYSQLTALGNTNGGGGIKWYWWVGGVLATVGAVFGIVAVIGKK